MDAGPRHLPAQQSTAAAFETFIEVLRKSSPTLDDLDPSLLVGLMRPFLVNPTRDAAPFKEVLDAYAAATMARTISKIAVVRLLLRLGKAGLRTPTFEALAPDLISRLKHMEAVLRSDIKPGSIALVLKPIRYLDTPAGFGKATLHRYRLQAQTLVEQTADDEMQATSLEISAVGEGADVFVDDMQPSAAFSTVALKRSSGMQLGQQATVNEKAAAGGELSGAVGKVSTALEHVSTEQASASVTFANEMSASRVQQYLVARKLGNRAIWRAVAGVGPIDAAGAEYTADFLVPASIRQLHVRVDAKVEWLRLGVSAAELDVDVSLPEPTAT